MGHYSQALDDWIRNRFADLNTELELHYREQGLGEDVEDYGTEIKQRLQNEGLVHIRALLAEGNTDEGFDSAFDCLGNVGFYMAACRRHLLTEPSRERQSPLEEASALALHLGASLGITPRFATSHLTTHNRAINGRYRAFTHLPEEQFFLDANTRAIFAFKQAADALMQCYPLGISHAVVPQLLGYAKRALDDVFAINNELMEKLDREHFFRHVRPYYKPYRVGLHEYRGANAGDFAGINIVDMLLGLCRANDSRYSQILVDKFLYMRPEDQTILRECMRRESLMDQFLHCTPQQQRQPWYREHLRLFLDVVEQHGDTAKQHHDQLVEKFIVGPSQKLDEKSLAKITASGPPLSVLLRALERLRDLRCATEREDIPSRFHDIETLRSTL